MAGAVGVKSSVTDMLDVSAGGADFSDGGRGRQGERRGIGRVSFVGTNQHHCYSFGQIDADSFVKDTVLGPSL